MATDYNAPHHRDLIERFEHTERARERQRQIDYQNGLGPMKTARELEIAELDRLDAIWRKTTRGY